MGPIVRFGKSPVNLQAAAYCDVQRPDNAARWQLRLRMQFLEKALDRVAKRTGRTKSEFALEALRRQVAVARFRELRTKTLPFAEAQGLVTDEDVFREILHAHNR